MLQVRNLISRRSGNAIANQFVIETTERTWFQSYESLCALVEWDAGTKQLNVTLGPDWDYSRAILKYLIQFLEEYSPFAPKNAAEVRKMIKDGLIKECDYESQLERRTA